MNTAEGTLSGTREYGAFGENISATGVGAFNYWHGIPFGFSTKYQDRLTGHYYYGYRFYDTNTGRWLSKDPIEEQGGLNLYAFVGNNGVNKWDLLGNISLGAKISFIFETRRKAGFIKYLFESKLPVYYLSDDEGEMRRPFMINIVKEAIESYIKKTSQGADGRYQLSSVDLRKYSNSILYYESATFFGTGWWLNGAEGLIVSGDVCYANGRVGAYQLSLQWVDTIDANPGDDNATKVIVERAYQLIEPVFKIDFGVRINWTMDSGGQQ